MGAAASVALINLITSLDNTDQDSNNDGIIDESTLEDQQAHSNLVATIIGAIAEGAGLDTAAATTAAQIEIENNGCVGSVCYSVSETGILYEDFQKTADYRLFLAALGSDAAVRGCLAVKASTVCQTGDRRANQIEAVLDAIAGDDAEKRDDIVRAINDGTIAIDDISERAENLKDSENTTDDAAQGALSNGGGAQSGDGVYDGNEIVVTGRRSLVGPQEVPAAVFGLDGSDALNFAQDDKIVVTSGQSGVEEIQKEGPLTAEDIVTAVLIVTAIDTLDFIRENGLATPNAQRVLDLFESDSDDRVIYFLEDVPGGSEAIQELLTTGPSEYFISQINNALQLLVDKSGSQILNGKWVLKEGAQVSGVRANNILTPLNKLFNTNIARGDFLDFADLADGIQLGDVTGTLTTNLTAHVQRDSVLFQATNLTTIDSLLAANVTNAKPGAIINNPKTGAFSTVTTHFEFRIPISKINNAIGVSIK